MRAAALNGQTGWTYQDILRTPDDGLRYEIIGGNLFVTPSPSTYHQSVQMILTPELGKQLHDTGRGIVFPAPTDLLIDDHNTVVPDLMVIRAERRHIIAERYITAAPDLVIEILSPSTRSADRGTKRGFYASIGVPEYRLVDPTTESVEVLHLQGDAWENAGSWSSGAVVRSTVFDFRVTVDRIFGG